MLDLSFDSGASVIFGTMSGSFSVHSHIGASVFAPTSVGDVNPPVNAPTGHPAAGLNRALSHVTVNGSEDEDMASITDKVPAVTRPS